MRVLPMAMTLSMSVAPARAQYSGGMVGHRHTVNVTTGLWDLQRSRQTNVCGLREEKR